jgi:transcriptional regulator GlxA family with amidase domain
VITSSSVEATVTEANLLVFEGCDLLDVGGPYEVLLTANRVAQETDQAPPFRVRTVSVDGRPVRAFGGLTLQPEGTAQPGPGLFLVPGAIDLGPPLADTQLMQTILRCGHAADLAVSVCTGSLLLAEAGLLRGVSATTHHADVGLLAERIGDDRALSDVRWVDAGHVVTSAGLSSGIAMALHLVARLVSLELATSVAHRLEYEWRPAAGVTVLAP